MKKDPTNVPLPAATLEGRTVWYHPVQQYEHHRAEHEDITSSTYQMATDWSHRTIRFRINRCVWYSIVPARRSRLASEVTPNYLPQIIFLEAGVRKLTAKQQICR
jgi:hypothetical protein